MHSFKKYVSLILCIFIVFPFVSACGVKALSFNGDELDEAKVGVEYYQSVATATGANDITYALKEGSVLPVGLTFLQAGEISGTPRTVNDNVSVTVVASAEGFTPSEAVFTFKVAEGELTYTGDATLKAAFGKAYSKSIATATGTAGTVSYSVTDGDLPEGLTLSAAGMISGTPTDYGISEFTVTASATDCASASAEFAIEIAQPWLEYQGKALANGRVNNYYTAYVNTATGVLSGQEDTIIYTLNGTLPAGLELLSDGTVQGTPTAQVTRQEFKVTAEASGYGSAEATFTITIQAEVEYVGTGTIAVTTTTLPSAFVGVNYSTKIAANVTGVNPKPQASFTLKEGSTLPANFVLMPDGTIRTELGLKPLAVTEAHSFTVVASAPNSTQVEKEFTLKIEPAVITYPSKTLASATVNAPYQESVATAFLPEGDETPIVYTVQAIMIMGEFVSEMPEGLAVVNGIISGTPTKSYREIYLEMRASAEGYTFKEQGFSFSIREEVKTVSNGVFEVEYTDLNDKTGGGYSGGAEKDRLISNEWDCGASNGYYIPFTYDPISFEFVFNSSAVVSNVTLSVRLASEIGTRTFTSTDFAVVVNGVERPFTSFTLTGTVDEETGDPVMGEFVDISFGSISLLSGENIIVVKGLETNMVMGNRSYGPAVDCIKLGNFGPAVLTWRPFTYNIVWITGI